MEYLPQQQLLKSSIERAVVNLKKIGKSNITAAKIRARIVTLKENWMQFKQGHLALSGAIDSKRQEKMEYFVEDHYAVTEDSFERALDYLSDYLEEIEPPVSPNQYATVTNQTPNGSGVSLAHLPPINLPPFNGDQKEWGQFRDRFTTLIKNNGDLNNFARMHFLVSSLKGTALETIQNLPVTSDNFEIAWRALTSRYENKRRAITSHIATLINLPALARESAADLRSLTDRTNVEVESLKQLQRTSADLWNDILVHITVQKLDNATRKAWKLREGDADTPSSYDDLRRFLDNRTRALEELAASSPIKQNKLTAKASGVSVANATKTGATAMCPICKTPHLLSACSNFLSRSYADRRDIVKKHKRCFNCLSAKHQVAECKSKYSCKECQKKHHSLLHANVSLSSIETDAKPDQESSSAQAQTSLEITSNIASNAKSLRPPVLLATARVSVRTAYGHSATIRALLDQGSEMTFISESLAQSLHAPRKRVSISVSGVGGTSAGQIQYATQLWISRRDTLSPSFKATALILKSLTAYAPKPTLDLSSISHLVDLPLADPEPTSADAIHILIGADLYNDLILEGVRKGGRGQPLAQNSALGWVISGPVRNGPLRAAAGDKPPPAAISHISVHHVNETSTLETELHRFWEVEEIPKRQIFSPQEEQCETHFQKTYSRDPSGRYIVRLPFKRGPPINIGNSRQRAEQWLATLTRKLRSQPALEKEYFAFMTEYENLGHMRPAKEKTTPADQGCYIPHYAVIRDSSATTRLRVVFNASSKTSNGMSLNDNLLIGPKLQSEITSVILQWRCHKLVYTADIAKMYRQVLVDKRDIDFQRIIWHDSSSGEPRDYQLLTLTYGTACAPFLALRVIKQLIEDEGDKFPLAVQVLSDNIYVDDILFGAADEVSIKHQRDQVIALLRKGGFELRKWASNAASLLQDIDERDHGLACNKQLDNDERLKILGIAWNPSSDRFEFQVMISDAIPDSKRAVLSTIAKFYDPLGWVTPVTVSAKILLQQMWRSKLDWDEKLNEDMLAQWRNIYVNLAHLNGLSIPRWIQLEPDSRNAEIHGFADASNNAYAAVVYMRTVSQSGPPVVTLIAGKSKVVPLKPMSIPRLELCAALLLARILEFVRASRGFESLPCHCWTDSTVVLAWVTQHPSRWKTFVAHRVVDIQSRLPNVIWRQVGTHDNPADCASRGMLGNDILACDLWWQGPSWLRSSREDWPTETGITPESHYLEERPVVSLTAGEADPWDLESRFSSWPRLLRVTAYIMRFTTRCRKHKPIRKRPYAPEVEGAVTASQGIALEASEYQHARLFWIKRIQNAQFQKEIKALYDNERLATKSAILSLQPFVDREGVLRVGGRLRNARVPFSVRHPIILAAHPLTTLIVRQTHLRALHAGPQLTLNLLRRDFWILRARHIVRSVIRACVACARERASIPTQLMGDLPDARVTASKHSFAHCGVDYAGPVQIRTAAGRGVKSHKAYIALFICMATKAIHLELVGDYSAKAFLNAYDRFCARRGLPQTMYSDNGTTFAGADRELRAAYRVAITDPDFRNYIATDNVSWHFIPPSTPHFGGLWEAGVKSVKHHLRRVLGSHTLTFEEFTTLLCKIEACLNSRPLGPLSDADDDYDCLTPGHLLIGSPLTLPPEPSALKIDECRLSRWQLLRHMTERFWKQWQNDYVNTLQQRAKWRNVKHPIKTGQLVLIRNPNLPPCKWELGRVIECHPGSDDLTRVVTVRTVNSELRRPIGKICILPVDSEATSTKPAPTSPCGNV